MWEQKSNKNVLQKTKTKTRTLGDIKTNYKLCKQDRDGTVAK